MQANAEKGEHQEAADLSSDAMFHNRAAGRDRIQPPKQDPTKSGSVAEKEQNLPSKVVIGSSTELFLRERVAKKVVSKEGKIVIFTLYTLMIPFILYGCFSISI